LKNGVKRIKPSHSRKQPSKKHRCADTKVFIGLGGHFLKDGEICTTAKPEKSGKCLHELDSFRSLF
jgi:hypothetical protein